MALTINNFMGAETGGVEEWDTTFATGSAVTDPHTGAYCYSVTSGHFKPFSAGVADQGSGYIFGAWFKGNAANYNLYFYNDATTAVMCRISFDATTVTLKDTANGTVGSGAKSSTEWFFLELYVEKSATGAAQLFIDGVSVISTGSDDFSMADNLERIVFANGTMKIDDMYFMSGATAASDRLGGCEVLAYRSNLASATPDWTKGANGALNSGQWADAQEVPFGETNVAIYSDATARAGGVDTDDIGQVWGSDDQFSSYYIDGAVSDPDGVWTDDANAINGSQATSASCSTAGSLTTNEIEISGVSGLPTDAGPYTLAGVKVYVYIGASNSATTTIYTAGRGEQLGQRTATNSGTIELSTPTGGWTWAKLSALEAVVYLDATPSVSLWGVWIQAWSAGGPNNDPRIDGDTNIKAMKGVWRMKRAGGSGAVHYGLMGNTGTAIADSDRTADFDPTTAYANYTIVREDNLPLSTEYGRIGFEKDNKGQDFDCADMLFQILHVPDPVTGKGVIFNPKRRLMPFLVR